MKTDGQVRHKLQQVTYRHLQRTVRTALSCRPENCVHNGAVSLPTGEVHYCNLLETKDGMKLPCDEAFGGLAQAAKCPDFSCKNTKEKIQKEFAEFLENSDVATIASRYPDVAALLWVLDTTSPPVSQVDPDPPPPSPPLPPVKWLFLQPDGTSVSYSLTPPQVTYYRAVVYKVPVRGGDAP